jgi:hypothetical protein
MTNFEQMLIDKGYIKYILNHKTMKYELAKGHVTSSSLNLDHRYFHKTDLNVLSKIENEKSVMEKDFTWEDRKGEICFGLNEVHKPATLIYPRPRINIKKIVEDKEEDIDELMDDSMNIVLKNIPHEEIFKAMYDHNIFFEIDLTIKSKTNNKH